jgi:alanine-glyoxylate transaminase/serine-glyoxylate transaminase/serine-pyruvate transaminase
LDPFFFQVNEEIRAGLQQVFGTQNPFTLALSGTGSAGMEAAVTNFVEPGSKFLVFANGYFCDRLTEMGIRQEANVVRIEKPWGQKVSDEEAAEAIHREKPQVVAFVHGETSTGVSNPGHAIAKAAREVDALTIADCVTSLGTMPINLDAVGLDIAYSCTQKGMSCPPGLAPITCSPRAMDRLRARKSPQRTWYLDLKLLSEYYDGAHRYHHTAPISMFYALREGIALILDEGVEARFERHRQNAAKLTAGLEAMGLEMLVPAENRMWALHTPKVPAGVSDLEVRKKLMERHGIEILGGFGPLAGQVFRIGLMGEGSQSAHVDMLLGALKEAL